MSSSGTNDAARGEAWKAMALPAYEVSEFTPQITTEFRGIKIWAPAKIGRGAQVRIPLFGVVQLGESELAEMGIEDRHPLRAVVVGAVAAGTYAPFVGNAVLQAPLLPAEDGDPVREVFAVDLVEAAGVPPAVGKYFVFASVGPFVAEPVTVEVVG
jgi:hypothetical protein